jgi:DNA-directed RNA polymerase specialized sigma24 family protein
VTESDIDDTIQRVTSSLKKQFHQVEREDIYQELWLKYLSTNTDHMNSKMLWTSLRRAGVAFCTREKAAITGYDVEDLYYYSTGQLRDLLPVVLDRESWGGTGVVQDLGKITGGGDPAHGNNRLAMICDVRSALEACSDEDKRLLWTVFGLRVDDDEYATSLGITADALRMRVVRALKRLQRHIGGPRPDGLYEGTRRALSNAQAQAVTRNQEAPE